MCVEFGAGIVYTEMTVAMHLVRAPEETMRRLRYHESERPVFAQLAVGDVASAVDATKLVEQLGFNGVDLNLGCSVRRLLSGGMGSALAADPPRLAKILSAVVQATRLPVTVKMRSGPDARTETASEIARLSEDCGAAGVAVHGRHARQGYRGKSDTDVIARVKASVTVPVIGNGDIRTPADAVDMLTQTGCDAVMIGRGAMGNPWIFRRATALLETGEVPHRPSVDEARNAMLKHYHLLVEERGRHYANLLFRKQTSSYAKLAPHPRRMRQAVHSAGKDDDLSIVIDVLMRAV
jgi:nifR3 family TIM-barrel protein